MAITVSATTFSGAGHALPDTGAVAFTGSVSSLASTAPSATCVGSCVLPADATTYPVSITTAASAPPVYTVYDTPAGTGEGELTLGGSDAAHPIGWWVQVSLGVPRRVHVGSDGHHGVRPVAARPRATAWPESSVLQSVSKKHSG